jgi:glutathione synthase/RimK-type ligase-like ATP-grasp enzyme
VLLAQAMRAKGLLVEFLPWNDPEADWQAGRLTMVRSAWDYHHHAAAWLAWIKSTSEKTVLLNSGQTLRWNTDKRYLRDLIGAGVACIPTHFVEPHMRLEVLPHGHSEWIVKPAMGASARGVRRFAEHELPTMGKAYVDQLAQTGAVLIQPYIAEVETVQERSLVFVGGRFSHSFTKPAFSTGATGGTAIARHWPTTAELELAAAALSFLEGEHAYARVDIVPTTSGPQLMELELIEPDLGLRLESTAVDGLVDVCIAYLERS